ATSKCLPRLFAAQAAKSFSRLDAKDPTAEKACAGVFKDLARRDICVRSPMTTGWGEEKAPALDTPDPYRTTVTDDRHMPKQCRMDTQFQGALCAKPI